MMPYFAAVAALVFLGLAFKATSVGLIAFALLACVVSLVVSFVGFLQKRVGENSRSQVYVPSREERELLARRAERQRQEFEKKRLEPMSAVRPQASNDTPPPSRPTSTA